MGILKFVRERFGDPDPRVRLREIEKLEDQDGLAEIACTDDSPRVRLAALARVADDGRLARVAMDGCAIDVRLAAVERIEDEQLLARIIKERKNFELMGACFRRITDRALLERIAQDDGYNPAARRLAVEQFADESYLADLERAGGGGDDDGEDRKSDEAVDAILSTYGDVRVVRALGRFRGSEKALRALGTITRKGEEIGGLAVEYLTRSLGSRNPRLAGCAADELVRLRDPEMVRVLARGLDDPELSEPTREVLRRIDTPAARAALGQDGG